MRCCLLPPMGSSHSKAKMGCDAGARRIQKKSSLSKYRSYLRWEEAKQGIGVWDSRVQSYSGLIDQTEILYRPIVLSSFLLYW